MHSFQKKKIVYASTMQLLSNITINQTSRYMKTYETMWRKHVASIDLQSQIIMQEAYHHSNTKA